MNKFDRELFAQVFSTTCLAYDRAFSKELAELFFSDLSDFDIDVVRIAFKSHRKDADRGRFFPKLADIIYQIQGTAKQAAELLESKAEIEWAAIVAAASGGYEPKNISIESRSALRSLGGINKVGYTFEKDLPFLKRDFVSLVKSITAAKSDQLDESLPLYSELIIKKTQVAVK